MTAITQDEDLLGEHCLGIATGDPAVRDEFEVRMNNLDAFLEAAAAEEQRKVDEYLAAVAEAEAEEARKLEEYLDAVAQAEA